jgi:hypothetical protein
MHSAGKDVCDECGREEKRETIENPMPAQEAWTGGQTGHQFTFGDVTGPKSNR